MAWKVSYRNSFKKVFKKLDKKLQNKILDIADEIVAGNDCNKLKHSLKEFYSCHFNRKPEYRLLYSKYECKIEKENKIVCKFDDIEHTTEELKACNGLIEFVLVDTREAFNKLYKMKKSQKKNLLR